MKPHFVCYLITVIATVGWATHTTLANDPATAPATRADPTAIVERIVAEWHDARGVPDHYEVTRKARLDLNLLIELAADDPTAEKGLERLSKLERGQGGDEALLPDIAEDGLRRVVAAHTLRQILEGAQTPEEQLKRMQNALKDHPKWLHPDGTAKDIMESDGSREMARLLLLRAATIDPDWAVPLMVQANLMKGIEAQQYAESLITYAKQLKGTDLYGVPHLTSYLEFAYQEEAFPIMQRWLDELKQEPDDRRKQIVTIITVSIGTLPNGIDDLKKVLDSVDPYAASTAARRLRDNQPTHDTLTLLQATEKRLQSAHAPPDVLESMSITIKRLMEDIARQPTTRQNQTRKAEAVAHQYIGSEHSIEEMVAQADHVILARVVDLGVISADDPGSARYDGIKLAVTTVFKGSTTKELVVTATARSDFKKKTQEIMPKNGETAIFFLSKDLKVLKVVANDADSIKQVQSAVDAAKQK